MDFAINYDFDNGDDLDVAVDELMESEASGKISFIDVECLMEYIDKQITENVSREGLVKRVRSLAQRRFCIRSMHKQKKERADNSKGEQFRQSAD